MEEGNSCAINFLSGLILKPLFFIGKASVGDLGT